MAGLSYLDKEFGFGLFTPEDYQEYAKQEQTDPALQAYFASISPALRDTYESRQVSWQQTCDRYKNQPVDAKGNYVYTKAQFNEYKKRERDFQTYHEMLSKNDDIFFDSPTNTVGVIVLCALIIIPVFMIYRTEIKNIAKKIINFSKIKLFIIITSIFLFITAFFDFKMPYVYFQLLRWCVFLCSLVVAYDLKDKKDFIFILFCIIAVLFNPLAPIHMERESWRIVDGIAGFLVLIPLFIKKKI